MRKAQIPQTLAAMLTAQKDNQHQGITFITAANKEEFLSYQQLYNDALTLLGYMQRKGVKPGNEVVLQVDDNKVFVQLFWACIMGGIIPVPVAVTYQGENARKLYRIWQILHHPYLLTTRSVVEKLYDKRNQDDVSFESKTLLAEDAAKHTEQGIVQPVTPDDIAFLQFSSGSTGNPKGVVLKHSNLVSNITSAMATLENVTDDRRLSWMPLTHDLGLIFFHLYPVSIGAQHFLMPTDLFIRHPLLWMQKISDHQVTVTGSPNFGYKYYLNQFSDDKAAHLNLQSLQVILNGAEPISGALCRRFNDTLSRYNLHASALRPAYGLAESTLIVSFAPADSVVESVFVHRDALTTGRYVTEPGMISKERAADNMEIVNTGRLLQDASVRIADENGVPLKEGGVGIIWINGPSVTERYYNNEAATNAVIRDGWLNTGDTGFMLNNNLYIVGRVKDIIIVNGMNVYPHDIEQAVEALDGIETGKVVACGVPNEDESSEAIVIFVLFKLSPDKFVPLAREVKRLVASQLGLEVKHVLPVRKIEKTTSGKVKRYLFAEEFRKGKHNASIDAIAAAEAELARETQHAALVNEQQGRRRQQQVRSWLEGWLQQHLRLSAPELAQGRTFTEYGITSMQAVQLANDLEGYLQEPVDNTVVYNFPNVSSLAAHFSGLRSSQQENRAAVSAADDKIAVIGMGCRLPGNVHSPEDFWKLLLGEKNTVTGIPADRWNANEYYDAASGVRGKMYTREGSFISDADKFDPLFFGISPREAEAMDPQQRLLLEVCWEALEHAGLKPSDLRGSDSGVFIGMGADDYQQLIRGTRDASYFEDVFTGLGTERSIAAGRIAYVFDFHGPVVQLDTACSSSLVSVHQACQSLLYDNCSLALAGGVNLMLSPDATVKLCQMQALSPTGSCKTFDDNADGYVRGEGAGIIVLKRLSDAIADGDQVLAVISATAVNHDGLSNGISAPNGAAQQQLISNALKRAGLSATDVQYVETHGTGTRLGDPVEVQALNAIYGRSRTGDNPLLLGAVKSNIGHLEAAAGIAGLIKTVLCLQHREIPASIHFHTPNRYIPWKDMSVRVVDRLTPWESAQGIRRGAVSAFGLSGTNAHAILEEAPAVVNAVVAGDNRPSHPLLLSARNAAALKELSARYAAMLNEQAVSVQDLALSTALSRDPFQYRIAVEVSDTEDTKKALEGYAAGRLPKGVLFGNVTAEPEKPVWLFTGQGSQYWGMGRELYHQNPVFRKVIDYCDAYLKTQWGISLVSLLYEGDKEERNALLRETQYTQPALFAIECALAEVWKSWGITPSMVAGHSVGEFAAAYIAGVFSLDDGLRLITERAKLMHAVEEPGGMAMIFAPETDVRNEIQAYGTDLSVAAVNGPTLTVISGKKAVLADTLAALKKKGMGSRELAVSQAFHSSLMEPVIADFRKVAESVRYHTPAIPLVSNVTGNIITDEITDAAYWCRHILAPVLFSQSMQTVKAGGADTVIELGPQPNLLSMAQLTVSYGEGALLPSMRESQSSWSTMLQALIALYTKGVQINWKEFYAGSGYKKMQLPPYPFQRQRYWIKEEEKTIQPQMPAVPVVTAAATSVAKAEVMTITQPVAGSDRRATITANLVEMLSRQLKISPEEINIHTPFLSQGADSLILATVVRRVESEYGLSFTMRLLFEKLTTVELMAEYIATNSKAQPQVAAATNGVAAVVNNVPAVNGVHTREVLQPAVVMPLQPMMVNGNGAASGASSLQHAQLNLIAQQFQLLTQQLQLVSNNMQTVAAPAVMQKQAEVQPKPVTAVATKPGGYKSIFPKMETTKGDNNLTPQQQAYLDAFIAKYTARTKTSRAITQQFRPVLADIRVSAGFRFMTKEMLYPIVAESSMGARITDVDGNEYIDLAMGFGVNLLGHRPQIVTEAINRQLEKGYQLGPQTRLAGEVAAKIASLTGMDRVSFHNSGTEAVMSAMRVARTLTGKNKIAIFQGSYHGYFDGTLALAEDLETDNHGVPVAQGIMPGMVADVLVFDYLNPDVVKQIQAHAHELAAVLVEPVQSRRPGYQPKELLKELRAMTAAEKIILIFDEMITGFRIHPGGVQAHFGIAADMVTYGKIIGGGFPIGVIAGRDWCMNTVDGGLWDYGDDSYPQAETTFLAGTFCKHPVSMAASLAILNELENRGPALQRQLSERADRLVAKIKTLFEENNVPIQVNNFGSLFFFTVTGNMDLFFYHLIEKGVYIWEGRSCFLSAAHTDDDIRFIEQAFVDSVMELKAGGFLPDGGNNTPSPRKRTVAEPVLVEAQLPVIGKLSVPEHIPLSYSQERMWLIDQLDGSVQYNIPLAVRLKGPVNKTALSYALRKIVSRHEVLRTVVDQEDGQPYQRILPAHEWQLIITDNALLKEDPAALREYVSAEIHTPFNLSSDRMFRVNLVSAGNDEHVLIFAVHHIVFDDWSIRMMFDELVELYDAYVSKRSAVVPVMNMQYKDYAVWQRSIVESGRLQGQLEYWKQQLNGFTPTLLPTDFERGAVKSNRGATVKALIEKPLAAKIQQLGRSQGVTLYATLLAAFKLLLARYSGQTDVNVATAIAGRTVNEVEPLLGYFANMLVLRTDISEASSFETLLKNVSRTVLDAHENQDIPFNKVVEAVAGNRDGGDNPLMHIIFGLQNIPVASQLRLGDATVAYEPVARHTSIADITWTVEDRPHGITIEVEYASDLFKAATVQRMIRHYINLLQQVTLNAAVPVSKLDMLDEKEKQQLLISFNDTRYNYPDKTVTVLFDEQVNATPDARAVSAEGQSLTYRELQAKANQVAHYLVSAGVRPGDKIGLLSYRGLDMIVAIWGILKSGAAYVPFHTGFPPERLHLMIEDARITKVLFTDNTLFGNSGIDKAKGLNITAAANFPVSSANVDIHVEDCVNVMYTSGTTGRPKGIVVNHRNIVKLVHEPGAIAILPEDRVLQWSNYAFDGSTYDIFNTLLRGACLCMISDAAASDALELSGIMQRERITVCFMTAALFNSFVDSDINGLRGLRKILFGGEKASLQHVRKASAVLGAGRLVNVYGPTETTVYATSYTVDEMHTDDPGIPIGRPLANTQAVILNQYGDPVPVGIDGELYIGGDGVTTGYINNEQLTKEKFVSLPGVSGRWYRTGDLCRWLPDGNILYTGRADDQVKVRGYRIEPGEIERAMNQLHEITASCVIARQQPSGDKKLVAYYVPAGNISVSPLQIHENIRQALQLQLPEYMVPSAFIALEQLPLTSNGKTDRKLLSNRNDDIITQKAVYKAPATLAEKQLTAIWERLLGVERVGVQDSFFELGGHSLLATRVVSAVRKEMNTELSVRDLFRHATVERLAAYLQQQQPASLLPAITAITRSGYIPLSYSQERLWFIDQLEGSMQYVVPVVLRLKGALNEQALEHALRKIMNRHEVLRTVIDQADGQPFQHVRDSRGWELTFTADELLKHSPAALNSYISAQVYTPFDLSKDYMLRAELISITDTEHVLLLIAHHIVFDDWSVRVVFEELVELYNAFVENRTASLPALEIQYKDYAIWQRLHLQGSLLDEKLAYWKQQLRGVTPMLLPTDFERPLSRSTRGAVITAKIDKTLAEKIQQLTRTQGTTLYTALLAAFKVLLYRYTSQEDVVVATAITGRTRHEVEPLLGFFANTLVLRTDLSDDPSFETLLKKVNSTVLDAHEHQEAPLSKVVEAVAENRGAGDNPLLHVIFTLQQIPALNEIRLGDALIAYEPAERKTSIADITWTAEERPDGIGIEVEYATDLFKAATIQRMLLHYINLLQQVTINAAVPVNKLDMLNETEKQQLLISFNDSRYNYPDKTVTTLFDEQVGTTPDATAVSADGQSLTYRELQAKANQVAQYLLSAGVKPGDRIGLLSYRGLDMIVAIWGILKSGAAYVPFHTGFPPERLHLMMEDAGITQVLFTDNILFENSGIDMAKGLDIANAANFPAAQANVAIRVDDCVNIMYTSGTTGRPKGIVVNHRNIVKLVFEPGAIAIQPEDRVLQWSNYAFDGSAYDIFNTLLHGASLCMISDAAASDALELSGIMQREHITVCFMTTALFNSFVDSNINGLRGLRKVLFGGEKVSLLHVQKALAVLGTGRLVHVYGPTETTVYATSYSIDQVHAGDLSVPIGRPLANTQAVILNQHGELLPAGIDGELYIGGDGVTAGYINNEQLTNEKFISLPGMSGRWYRTGDLCRRLPDGNILYTGRADDQVKIRGYRIEPGEIERAMNQLDEVAASCVIAKQQPSGDKKLVAYYVPSGDTSISPRHVYENIRQALQVQLPEYMVPSAFIALEQLPLTSNGKTDRKLLAGRNDEIIAQKAVYKAPVTLIEQQLVTIWQRLLGVERIGVQDSFFELGGHSLLATRVVSAVRKEMHTELSVRDLFNHATIERLAAYLQDQQPVSLLPAITAAPRPGHIPLSYSQERLWFIDQLEGSVQYHMSAAFNLSGNLDTAALEYALRGVVNRHEILRTIIVQEGGNAWQRVMEKDLWHLYIQDAADCHQNEAALRARINDITHIPFDLSRDHMMRAYLLKLAPGKHTLVLYMHHVASDGWSLSVLVNELVELYNAHAAGRVSGLEPLPVQYADFSLWQRQHLTGDVLDEKVSYWRKQLEDLPVLKLPADFERPVVNSTRGAMQMFRIDKELTAQLQRLSQEQGATLYMTLVAVFKVLMYRYSGQEDIAVGSGIAGRMQQEIEPLIGFFVNTLVIRSRLTGNPTFADFLQQVRKTTLDDYEHQEAPFEKVVEAMLGARDVSKNPLFQVMFALQNMPETPELRLGNVTLTNQPIDHTTSMFDLFLSVKEEPDGIEIETEYCIDLFTERTIQKMMDHYISLLRAVVQQVSAPIGQLGMLSKEEVAQLLSFNNNILPYPSDKSIITLFEEQVQHTPGATALVFGEQSLSYRRLNERASQLAEYLRTQGVKENTLVPLCFDRSPELIISILAILKTGAAYVPLDPSYPAERIAFMLEDTAANVVVTTTVHEAALQAAAPAATFICVDAVSALLDEIPARPGRSIAAPGSLAYVIYTSGSTGRPKGALVTHRNVVSLVKGGGFVSLTPQDVILSTGSPSFDATTFEYWGALLNGGQLVLCPEKQLLDNMLLAKEMHNRKVTKMWFTASWFNQLVDDDISIFNGLEAVLAGGEKLSDAHVERFLAAHPGIALINGYGPTENTTFSLTHHIKNTTAGRSVPIGRPLANRQAYVLDQWQRPVPVGVPGELYVGGAGVSHGYLNQPALTADKFVADPFSNVSGATLYRTGDKARWIPDGTVEYLGRIDDQVKIRGFRIEPGEIERTMNALDNVASSAVVVKQQQNGEKRLAGYYIPDPAQVLKKEQQLYRHHVDNWRELYEMAFTKPADFEIADPEFDITGWNDSFTGGPIPAEQMRDWLNDIAGLILSLKPSRVLEIGCGTGLIYYQLASHINRYIGTDFSPVSTGQLQSHINRQLRRYPDTELRICAAHEIDLDPTETIDLVVLNSVVQYFPGAQYMTDVLGKAIGLLKGKGHIVIGDVRDLRLLPDFKRRLQLNTMLDRTSVKDFGWNVDQEVLKEEELCFSPAYFYELRNLYPEIRHVEIQWKQGDYINELTLYRYTVVLYVGIDKETATPDWQMFEDTAAVYERIGNNDDTIALTDVPNHRLWREQLLEKALTDKSVHNVRGLTEYITTQDSVTTDITALLRYAAEKGYRCRSFVSNDPMKMHVLLERASADAFIASPFDMSTAVSRTNIPLFPDICTAIEKEMQQQLQERLPEYMIPAEFTALQYLPLTNNGKTDRRFLSEWEDVRQKRLINFKAPVTPEETVLAEIWQRLLGVERVGVLDNFFELGGHSLLATRVVSAIRKQLDVELTVKDFFVYPTISQLATYLRGLQGGTVLPAITAVTRPVQVPLSFGQERLWFIDRLQGSVQYHMPLTLRLKGNLNKAALEAALQQIVQRHEALRTVVNTNEATGAGYQRILDAAGWHMFHADMTAYADNREVLSERITALVAQPFDLSADYMLRAHLLQLGHTEHILVAVIHHISSDGWSISNFVKELVTIYQDLAAGMPVRLKPLGLQYADYAIWQHTYLTGDVLNKQLAYWKQQLGGSTQLHLPGDFERPATQSIRGAAISYTIEEALTKQLNVFSQQQGVTLFMTLLAAFKVLLYRYSGQEDISVGSGVAGRTQEETEDMIGFFVNTLVMRSQLNNGMSFIDFLQQVKETTLNAYANQDAPFESVVETVVEKRDISVNPLFQVVFLLQNAPKTPVLQLGGVTLSEESFGHTTSLFDMSFFVTEHAGGLQLDVEYCTDLFREATMQRLLGYYHQLLSAVVKAPQQLITELNMLNNAERQQLLVTFNEKTRDYSAFAGKTIVDMLASQVVATPDLAALVFHDTTITYRELDERSNQLAHYLTRVGVQQEMLVPVCIERSPEMIIAIIAILKAGGAYVPVDTEYPADRMAYILEDTNASIMVSSSSCADRLPLNERHTIITIDNIAAEVRQLPLSSPGKNINIHHLAYLIYTSGSTGKPKGVMIEHGSVVNLALSMKEELRLQPGLKTLQFASIGFDAACYEIFNTLLSGGCLVLTEKEQLLSGAMLEALLNKHDVSLAVLPPSYLQAMKDSLGCLRTIVSAGEALSRGLATYVKSRGIRLINAYGPTESTVCASLTDTPVRADNTVVIGTPVANVPLYVLGPGDSLSPLGGAGELCIGGVQVARGYLNRLTLTEERFIDNPFGEGRIYKTGDLVRWLPDGNLVYLGRRDEQVKIRGHRIELGEIENVLEDLSLVAASCVVVKKQEYNNRLVCYYVATDTLPDPVQELRAGLQQRLPDYMIPGNFIAMNEMPVTSSGKIDRKYLSQLEDADHRETRSYQPPVTATERHLAAIWQELLGVQRVGIYDNFFEMGGDSIITIQVVNRAKHYGHILQPRNLFTHQTISALATLLATQDIEQISGEQGFLQGESGLLPVQHWYLEDESNVSDHFIQSVPFELNKAVSPDMLKEGIRQLVSFHDSLRFAYSNESGSWRQRYGNDTGTVVIIDLRNTPEDNLYAEITAYENKYKHSLNMREGKLVCAVMFLTPESVRANRLLMVIHHLGVDVVSWRILLDDMDRIFSDIQAGREISLKTKSSSYREWYNALYRYSHSERLLSQRAYWLKAAADYLPLRTDKQYNGLVKMSEMTAARVVLDASYTSKLLQDVSQAYRTDVKDVLLAAFALTMTEWMDTSRVSVGFEKHGREDIAADVDISHTTGWFTTISPVLLDTSAGRAAAAILQSVKEQLQAVPDKGIGFGVLKYLCRETALQGNDPWDVIFNYHGQIDNVSTNHRWLALTDATSELRMIGSYTMRFKLFVDTVVAGNELVVDWLYSMRHYEAATMKMLGEAYIRHLKALIDHCMTASLDLCDASDVRR
ncbi:MAG TPA: amino acid adenylation domain-containing protein [Chitinophaga sp.]|uniref:non-ribosomal peptide synthetase/type I polyketide synthase n=1 Tax=Chitinophaga sp. TaxID=1869181 RepID=UPI002C07E167|nr:non-ribosomal peptide synthetase/type I polyketide synthase [Chitinophaga sp.]HVI46388.1 amino acid adenylation domain-containing protein [Chitinophaga sp.]